MKKLEIMKQKGYAVIDHDLIKNHPNRSRK